MPRSTNPANYEEVYWDLLHGMRQEVPEIKLDLEAATATKVKFTFYAFIRALEVQGEKKRKSGDMVGAGELQEFGEAMRKYLVDIKENGARATLRFINRDLNPMTKSMRDQVKEQLNILDVPTLDRTPIEVPPVDSFFGKPLEIKDDGEQRTDGGVPTNTSTD